jgi:hypothetical protein
MGESKLKLASREETLLSSIGMQMMVGRVQLRWESESAATPMEQLAYFIEFLNLTEVWRRWLESCPLSYASPNAPARRRSWVPGCSPLSGHRRYAHVTEIRCDGVNPGLLRMNKVISEDALRNALKPIPEVEGCAWLDGHLSDSVAPLLDAAWILDIDPTITLTVLHAHFEKARAALMRVSAMLQGCVDRATEQLNPTTVWNLVCDHLKHILAGIVPPACIDFSKIMQTESLN